MLVHWAFAKTFSRLRRLFAPHYHPERHYMRGPGPACAARAQGDETGLI